MKEVEKTVRKNQRKDIQELKKIKKNLRITIKNTKYTCEKRIFKYRLKFLKEHRTDKIKENRGNRSKRVAESKSNNTDNGRKKWEVKRKVKGHKSTLYQKQKRQKNIKQRRNIERISEVLREFTISRTTRNPTRRKNRTRDKHKILKNHR